MTSDTENERRVTDAIEALNDRDTAGFAEYHAADVAFREGGEDCASRDAVEAHEERMIEAFPDLPSPTRRTDVYSTVNSTGSMSRKAVS